MEAKIDKVLHQDEASDVERVKKTPHITEPVQYAICLPCYHLSMWAEVHLDTAKFISIKRFIFRRKFVPSARLGGFPNQVVEYLVR